MEKLQENHEHIFGNLLISRDNKFRTQSCRDALYIFPIRIINRDPFL